MFAARTEEGLVHIAIGDARRAEAWGKERKYSIVFLSSGTPQIPLVEFLQVDDHEATGEMISIIRGSDGAKKMYGPADPLPDVYERNFKTAVYRDRIDYARSWNKLAVVAREDEPVAMLNHALLRARLRKDV